MKIFKKIFYGFVLLILLAVIALLVTGNGHVLNGLGKTYFVGKTKPDIDDMKHFDVREINTYAPEPWPQHYSFMKKTLEASDLAYLDSLETVGFVVIHRDSLLFEQYWDGYAPSTRSNSFSMAKSFTGMLVGIAIHEGYIKSVDQHVSDFIPEFKEGKNASLTIRNLLQMTSGIPFGESYNSPFGYMAKAYYGKNLVAETMKYQVERDPGTYWIYEGGNTVLLSMILQKATNRTLSKYFEEKVWSCIGSEYSAFWNLDQKDGLEKAYSAVYATPRDFARIGALYLHHGAWKNDSLVPASYVKESLTPNMIVDSTGEKCSWYGYQWWIGKYNGHDLFSCRGMRGQYIVAMPDYNLVLVRTGHEQSKERKDHMPLDLYRYIAIAAKLAEVE